MTMRIVRTLGIVAAAALGALATSGLAQSADLAAARQAGIVGERYDGYMGLAAATTSSVRKQVSAVNIKRRTLYIGLASRRRVTPAVAGMATGCELLSRTPVGGAYMLSDGVWRRRNPGEPPPSPEHCPPN